MINIAKDFIRVLRAKLRLRPKHLSVKLNVSKRWYGNNYGGFFLHPDILKAESIVYSFGIGEDISFDTDVIKQHGCHVYGFDPTPKSVNWVQSHQSTLPPNFKFLAFGISDVDGEVDFYLPKNSNHVSGSLITQNNVDEKHKITVMMKSIPTILDELGHTKIDVLKMDIEGAEYQVLESMLRSRAEINQISIEFHDRFFKDGREKTKRAIQLLSDFGFEIIAVSDSLEEITFLKKKLLIDIGSK